MMRGEYAIGFYEPTQVNQFPPSARVRKLKIKVVSFHPGMRSLGKTGRTYVPGAHAGVLVSGNAN